MTPTKVTIDVAAGENQAVAWLRMRAEAARIAAQGLEREIFKACERLLKLDAEGRELRDRAGVFERSADALVKAGFADVTPAAPAGAGEEVHK